MHISDKYRISDYYLFIIVSKQPLTVLSKLLKVLKPSIHRMTRSKHAITCYLEISPANIKKIQIILRSYSSPSEVITGFDLDSSGLCWYNDQLYATPRAYFSLSKMIIHLDIDRMSTTYNYRLIKYSMKKGFAIRVPYTITDEMKKEVVKHVQLINRSYGYSYIDQSDSTQRYNDSLLGLLVVKSLASLHGTSRHMAHSDYDLKPNAKHGSIPVSVRKHFNQHKIFAFYSLSSDSFYGYLCHRIEDAIDIPWKAELGSLTDLIKIDFPPKIEFMTKNPGTQLTASFHPLNKTAKQWCRIFSIPPKYKDATKNETFHFISNRYMPLLPEENYFHLSDATGETVLKWDMEGKRF